MLPILLALSVINILISGYVVLKLHNVLKTKIEKTSWAGIPAEKIFIKDSFPSQIKNKGITIHKESDLYVKELNESV